MCGMGIQETKTSYITKDNLFPINTSPIPFSLLSQLACHLVQTHLIFKQMYNLTKLKILVIGPEASGKTAVVNYLSQKSNVLDVPYRPTNSVRIVEHQTEVDNRLVSIEFWDVSGNIKNERVWPGIQKEAQGVIVVFNGDNPKSEAEADTWVEKFPKALNIPVQQCVAFSQHLSGSTKDKKPKTLKAAPNMKVFNTCIEEGSSTIYPAFDTFLNALIDSLIEKQQKEEQNLMDQ